MGQRSILLDPEKRGRLLNAFHRQAIAGFTLIELMIAIAIFAIGVTLGIPSFSEWIQNTQIRNAAESVQNGMQRTRAEAVKRNANIFFILDPAMNSSWQIRVAADNTLVESRTSSEVSKKVTVRTIGSNTLTFNNLGQAVTPNPDGTAPLQQVDFSSSVLTSARALRVNVLAGGSVRMCDPNLATGSSPGAC